MLGVKNVPSAYKKDNGNLLGINQGKNIWGTGGSIAGSMVGAKLGMALGCYFGPWGVFIGGAAGGVAGSICGQKCMEEVCDLIHNNYNVPDLCF